MGKIKNGVKTGLSGLTCLLGTAIGAEVVYVGSTVLANDAKHVYKGVKEIADPTPIKMKVKQKGKLVSKTEINKVNPFTGKITPYTGNKKPVNKKAIKVKY